MEALGVLPSFAPAAEPQRARYNLGSFAHQLVVFLPSPGEVVPEEVREANAEVSAAYDRFRRAGAELHAARQEMERAPSIDRSADRTALAADQPLPALEDRAEPRAKIANAAAERKSEAREHGAQEHEAQVHEVQRGDLVGLGPCVVVSRRGGKLLVEDPDGLRFVISTKRIEQPPWQRR